MSVSSKVNTSESSNVGCCGGGFEAWRWDGETVFSSGSICSRGSMIDRMTESQSVIQDKGKILLYGNPNEDSICFFQPNILSLIELVDSSIKSLTEITFVYKCNWLNICFSVTDNFESITASIR